MSRQTLGEACSRLSSGKAIKAAEIEEVGSYPVIGGNGLRGYTEDFNFDGECAVIGRQGAACGNVRFHSGKAYMTEHAVVAVVNEDNDSHYLAYLLSTMGLGHLSGQSAQPGLSVKTLSKQEIDLPPLDVQKQVVEVLGSLDEKIAANAKLNGYLEELAITLLHEKVYESHPFGEATVREFTASMSNGATPSRKNDEFWAGGTIPWVKTGEVNNNLIFETNECITSRALEKTSVHLLPKDTVVMALYGSGTAGRVAMLQKPATTNQACTAMLCASPLQSFYLFLTLKGMYREIDSKTRGSVQQNLSKDIVGDLVIPVVDEACLEGLGLSAIYKQMVIQASEISCLAALRDALLPKLMSGEIDVSDVDLTQLNSHLA